MVRTDILTMPEDELDQVDLTTLTASQLVQYGERADWTKDDLEKALALRGMLQQLDQTSLHHEEFMADLEAKNPWMRDQPSSDDTSDATKGLFPWFSQLMGWRR